MNLRLQGRAVLITGGTRGIGKAIALAYAKEGAWVAITYASDATAANEVVEQIKTKSERAIALPLDLAKSERR